MICVSFSLLLSCSWGRTITKFYTAKYDRVFKAIFCDVNNLGLLKEFLSRILELKIDSIQLLHPEMNVRTKYEHVKTVDVLVQVNEKYIHIEMNTSYNKYLHYRNFNYFTTAYNLYTKRGSDFLIPPEFVHIDFTYGLPQKYEIKTEYKVLSEEQKIPYIKNFKIIEFNMDKIMKFWYDEDKKGIQKYKEFIMLDLERFEFQKMVGSDMFMKEFEEKVPKLNENIEFVSWMTPEEDFECCKKMLENDFELSVVSKITGLNEEEIQKIQGEF